VTVSVRVPSALMVTASTVDWSVMPSPSKSCSTVVPKPPAAAIVSLWSISAPLKVKSDTVRVLLPSEFSAVTSVVLTA
jgi:hypothetical protein